MVFIRTDLKLKTPSVRFHTLENVIFNRDRASSLMNPKLATTLRMVKVSTLADEGESDSVIS